MNKNKKALFGIAATVVAICIMVAVITIKYRISDQTDGRTVIRVAFNVPLTGTLATYGSSIRDGAILAMEDIQTKDTSIRIDCDFQDNASEPKSATNIFMKHQNEKPNVYVSGIKPQTMAIIDRVEEMNIPHFTWIFDAFVTENYKNVFRTWVNYKMEAAKILQYVDELEPRKVAIAYVHLPHSEEQYLEIIIPELQKRGIDFIVERYPIEKSNFRDVATKFKSYEPDLMLFNGFSANFIPLVRHFREIALFDGQNALFSFDLLDASEELSNELLEGLRLVIPTYEIHRQDQEWNTRFEQRFRRIPRYTDAYAYDMMLAIYYAAKSQNNINLMGSLLSVEFDDAITGKFAFDTSGDLIVTLDIAEYKDGQIQRVQ